MDLKKNLFKTIGEIKTPERKLNVLMPVMVVICLAGVVYFLYTQLSDNGKSQLNDCKTENTILKNEKNALLHEKDSVIFRSISDKAETIRKLSEIIEKQEKQKKILRNLK